MRYQSGELQSRFNLIEVSRIEGIMRAMMMCSDEVSEKRNRVRVHRLFMTALSTVIYDVINSSVGITGLIELVWSETL